MRKEPGTWDYKVDYQKLKKRLEKLIESEPKVKRRAYYSILYIQLLNGLRIKEAIRSFKHFLETRERKFYIDPEKHGNTRAVRIPRIIKYREEYKFILNIDDEKLRHRILKFAKYHLGINTHSLRYAFITFLGNRGVAPQLIAKITGHKKLDYILRYTQKVQAEKILDQIIGE